MAAELVTERRSLIEGRSMPATSSRTERVVLISVTALSLAALAAQAPASRPTRFDEISVQRINIVEPDGTLRMTISNRARLPGIIRHGKEEAFDRPQAGMIFLNDEGSEVGGLIFGGRKNAKGEVQDAGGSLSFDRYDASQIVQLIGVHDKEDRFAGLAVTDSPPGQPSHRRIWVGSDETSTASVALSDAAGRKRILLQVAADGSASITFIDAQGKPVKEIRP